MATALRHGAPRADTYERMLYGTAAGPVATGRDRGEAMRRVLARVLDDEQGQGLVEYGLILLLVSILAVGSLTSLGQSIISQFYGPAAQMF